MYRKTIYPLASVVVHPVSVQLPSADMKKTYHSMPRTEDVFNLNPRDLELSDKLSDGSFGTVLKGTFKRLGKIIPVTVKTRKISDMLTAKVEINIFANFLCTVLTF